MEYIAFDSHQHDMLTRVEDADGRKTREARIAHERGALPRVLAACKPGSPVAVETIGNWYGIVTDIEARAIVTMPSSSGCRKTARTCRRHSGRASRTSTPW
jgi:hypothetical protein